MPYRTALTLWRQVCSQCKQAVRDRGLHLLGKLWVILLLLLVKAYIFQQQHLQTIHAAEHIG